MSTTAFPSPVTATHSGRTLSSAAASHVPTRHEQLAPFVDLEPSPYPHADSLDIAGNPVADLIPDELYEMLLAHNLISEKGVRDYIIRKSFRAMKEREELKSCEALARLQAIYPYLQIDTIRKIIYRIGPASNRKMMM